MDISFTEKKSEIMDGSKIATTRFNKDHWLGWLCHRRADFFGYLGDEPREPCGRTNIQDYLDMVCMVLYRDTKNGIPHGFIDQHGIPIKALPMLKAYFGSRRTGAAAYIGDLLVFQVKVGPFHDLTHRDAVDDGFENLEEFGKHLFDMHRSRLSNVCNDLDPRTCPHDWIHMKYVWLRGPTLPRPDKLRLVLED